ncbi:MAG: Flp pilus assembly complex ATPase component TadA [Phycisphaerae bacterium]|nr:Flp pilus assembly complex ATPase component TadA [Phycisphaerae bacterium]
MARRKKKLGEILVSWGLVNQGAISDAMQHAAEHGKRIGEALVELQLCNEEDVTKALAAQFDMEYVDLEKQKDVKANMDLVPEELIHKHKIVPLHQENGRLKVILSDPLDLETMDMLRFRLNVEVDPALASPSRIKNFIDKHFKPEGADDEDQAKSVTGQEMQSLQAEIAQGGNTGDDEGPVVRLINLMITEAVNGRASDIHVEPMADRVRVRYRIDGVCIDRDNVQKSLQAQVTARLKIMSGLDIAEKRLPQDGRIKMQIGGGDIDFRVSCLPGSHGESIVLRILRPESAKMGIQALGFEDDDYLSFKKIISRPNGMFLVTGPTGSGKTTTLYAALSELNRPDRKIITAEDPVEYNFSGINQCQVHEDIGRTFPIILRAMLRQAPQIILVGEIRDLAVAEVAVQAALTGHLVFSTLHTNDAPSSMARLLDMGVKPFLVASSVQAVMAQRLIRTLCQECREPNPDPDEFSLKVLGFKEEDLKGKTIYRPRGCSACHGVGFRGRKGIFEMMVVNQEIRELVFDRAPTGKVREAARAGGMRTLAEDGKRKILQGLTTPEEIVRIAASEVLEQDDA